MFGGGQGLQPLVGASALAATPLRVGDGLGGGQGAHLRATRYRSLRPQGMPRLSRARSHRRPGTWGDGSSPCRFRMASAAPKSRAAFGGWRRGASAARPSRASGRRKYRRVERRPRAASYGSGSAWSGSPWATRDPGRERARHAPGAIPEPARRHGRPTGGRRTGSPQARVCVRPSGPWTWVEHLLQRIRVAPRRLARLLWPRRRRSRSQRGSGLTQRTHCPRGIHRTGAPISEGGLRHDSRRRRHNPGEHQCRGRQDAIRPNASIGRVLGGGRPGLPRPAHGRQAHGFHQFPHRSASAMLRNVRDCSGR